MSSFHCMKGLLTLARRFFLECDGVVFNTTPLLEGPAIKAWNDWLGPRPIICPGPFDFPIHEQGLIQSSESSEVTAFLDAALEKYGPSSVIYVCLLHTFHSKINALNFFNAGFFRFFVVVNET